MEKAVRVAVMGMVVVVKEMMVAMVVLVVIEVVVWRTEGNGR